MLSSFCYGDEENARIYVVHLTTANQSEIRGAYLGSVVRKGPTGFSSLKEEKSNSRIFEPEKKTI